MLVTLTFSGAGRDWACDSDLQWCREDCTNLIISKAKLLNPLTRRWGHGGSAVAWLLCAIAWLLLLLGVWGWWRRCAAHVGRGRGCLRVLLLLLWRKLLLLLWRILLLLLLLLLLGVGLWGVLLLLLLLGVGRGELLLRGGAATIAHDLLLGLLRGVGHHHAQALRWPGLLVVDLLELLAQEAGGAASVEEAATIAAAQGVGNVVPQGQGCAVSIEEAGQAWAAEGWVHAAGAAVVLASSLRNLPHGAARAEAHKAGHATGARAAEAVTAAVLPVGRTALATAHNLGGRGVGGVGG